MRTAALFGEKNFGFFEIYGVSTRTRGLSQCGHFAKNGGQLFAILCRRLLWTIFLWTDIFFHQRFVTK